MTEKGRLEPVLKRLLGRAGSLLTILKARFVLSGESTVYPEKSVRIPAILITLMGVKDGFQGSLFSSNSTYHIMFLF